MRCILEAVMIDYLDVGGFRACCLDLACDIDGHDGPIDDASHHIKRYPSRLWTRR